MLARRFASAIVVLGVCGQAGAAPVRVVQAQGSMHGFLLLKSADGKVLAVGDLVNVARGGRVRSRLVFRFLDGSLDDETTIFKQGEVFKLLSDHHVQKGPSFPEPIDVLIDGRTGQVTSRSVKDGVPQVKTEHVDMPADVANGLVPSVLENFPARTTELKVSYVAADPKPRVVQFSMKREGVGDYEIGGTRRRAIEYNIHVELGGVAGVVAPLIGRQPSDVQIWVTDGEVPAFLKLQGALCVKGPIWTMELTSPRWH